ncbi:MAG: hypothetical protein JNL28_06650 [Planctomycetes bacterium]|nr:hypothetical protein [Planctomycetota bacterium]
MLRIFLTTLVAFLVTTGVAPAQMKSVPVTTPTKTYTKFAPPDAHECERIGLVLEEAVRLSDIAGAEAVVDWQALYTRAMNGIPAPERTRTNFLETADANLKGATGIMANLVQTVASGGSFRLLRVVENGLDARVVFRLAHLHGGVPDYVTFVLETTADGGTFVTDIDRASEGDVTSLRLRRYFLGLASGVTRNLDEKVRGNDRLRVQWQKQLEAADDAFLTGRNREVLEILASLPDDLARDRSVMLTRVNAARAISSKMFDAVLAFARATLPADLAIERIALDHFLETNAHDEARRTVSTVNAAVGGDPYLDWIAATIEDDSGDLAAARAACARAILGDERLAEPYWTLLSINVRERRFSDALRILESLNARFDIDWSGIESAGAYQAFFESEYGKAWKTRIASRR